MTNIAIPEHIKRFLDTSITSVTQLEVLLLLHGNAAQAWRVSEVSHAMYIQPESAAILLDDLVTHGVVTLINNSDRQYRYDPATAALGQTVTQLAEFYTKRRVTVITLIFSKPFQIF
jgi:DNA-binding IclR family transcriptional regulator